MADEEAKKILVDITARIIVLRDLVARMIANEAHRSGNPDAVLQDYSNAGDSRIELAERENPVFLQMSEKIRSEFDWVLIAARKMLEGEGH